MCVHGWTCVYTDEHMWTTIQFWQFWRQSFTWESVFVTIMFVTVFLLTSLSYLQNSPCAHINLTSGMHDTVEQAWTSQALRSTWRLCSSFFCCSQTWLASAVFLSKLLTTCWCQNFSWADRSCSLGRKWGRGGRGEELGAHCFRFMCVSVWMNVCICACMYVCVCGCVCVCMCGCVCVCVCVCMHVHVCTIVWVYVGRRNSSTLDSFLE